MLCPGVLYTTVSLFLFYITKKKVQTKKKLTYCILMILLYITVFLVTVLSSYFVFVIGILTAGLGSLLSFELTNRYITPLKYKKSIAFTLGGLSFLLAEILHFTINNIFKVTPLEYFFQVENSPITLLLEVFVFWQTIVGTKLFLELNKAQGNTAYNSSICASGV
jgi:hypothetical protein